MTEKKLKGQFFTVNSNYILQGFESFIKGKMVVDPFAGNGDLIRWSEGNNCKNVVGFDCDENYVDNEKIFKNDSINNPRDYKFICTNPPYLHKNKADMKTKRKFFSGKYSFFEDLYQVSIYSLLNCDEGIIVVPLNFLCAENSRKIRDIFFEKFEIIKLNIFSEQVFADTTYNVVSFYFRKKKNFQDKNEINAIIFPENKKISFIIERQYNWQFGGDFINRIKATKNNLGIFRLTEDYLKSGEYKIELALQNIKDKRLFKISKNFKHSLENNILFLRAIDSKNGKKIQLEDIRKYNIKGLVGKNTSRNLAHLIFKKEIPINEQECLMKRFNKELNRNRQKYSSFFLTNFRDNNRKRISFDFVYKFLNYLYLEKYEKQSTLF